MSKVSLDTYYDVYGEALASTGDKAFVLGEVVSGNKEVEIN